MKYFRLTLSVIVCLLFIIGVFFLREDLVTNRIKTNMLSDCILDFDNGSGTYLSRSGDSSQVVLEDGRIKGTGALIVIENSKYTGGFTIEVEGMTEKPSGVLATSLSNDKKYLAVVTTENQLIVYKTQDGKVLPFKEPIKVLSGDPLSTNQSSLPYVYWTNEGLVYNVELNEGLIWGVSKMTKVFSRLYTPETMDHKILIENDNLTQTIGKLDNNSLLILETPRDITLPKKIYKYSNGKTEELFVDTTYFAFSNSQDPLLWYKDESKIKTINLNSTTLIKQDFKLPEIDGKSINLLEISSPRITSKGYLYFELQTLNRSILIDSWSGVYVDIPNGKAPY